MPASDRATPEPTLADLPDLVAARGRVAPDTVAISYDGVDVDYAAFHERLSAISGPLSERGMTVDAIATIALTGLLPTIALAPPDELGALLDATVRDAAAALSADVAPTTAVADEHDTLVSLFDSRVARSPQALAVTAGDTTISYAELDGRANRLARVLIDRGVGPDDLVGSRSTSRSS